jgi:hypothetical protein
MIEPENVKPNRFPNPSIVYKSVDFAVAFGEYDKVQRLGMRWNGADEKDSVGYPHLGSYPVWFMFEDILALDFLKSLCCKDGVNEDNLKEAIGFFKQKQAELEAQQTQRRQQ